MAVIIMAHFIHPNTKEKIEYEVRKTNEEGLNKIYDNTFSNPELNEQAGLKNKYRLRSIRENISEAGKIDGDYIVYVRKDNGGYIAKVGWGEHETYTTALGTHVAPNYQPSGLTTLLLRARADALEVINKPSIVGINVKNIPVEKWSAKVAGAGRYDPNIKDHPDIPDDVIAEYKKKDAYFIKPVLKPEEDDTKNASFDRIFNTIIRVNI